MTFFAQLYISMLPLFFPQMSNVYNMDNATLQFDIIVILILSENYVTPYIFTWGTTLGKKSYL